MPIQVNSGHGDFNMLQMDTRKEKREALEPFKQFNMSLKLMLGSPFIKSLLLLIIISLKTIV